MSRILLVDDDADFPEATATVLSAAGFDVVSAAHYVEALDARESGSAPDMLLADIVMPAGINGIALALLCRQRIRTQSYFHYRLRPAARLVAGGSGQGPVQADRPRPAGRGSPIGAGRGWATRAERRVTWEEEMFPLEEDPVAGELKPTASPLLKNPGSPRVSREIIQSRLRTRGQKFLDQARSTQPGSGREMLLFLATSYARLAKRRMARNDDEPLA
jgi:CheY-like chemotaxis protein